MQVGFRCLLLFPRSHCYWPLCHQALSPLWPLRCLCWSTLLADNLTQSSIKVYLSAVRSLHIDNSLLDLLVNCLQLQRLLHSIKWDQGSTSPSHLPITIQQSLDTRDLGHVMQWAACCCGFYGFLQAGEFTVNSSFDLSVHLSIRDIQADSLVNPTCSKTNPFQKDCDICGLGNASVCPIVVLSNHLALCGPIPSLPAEGR